MAAALLLLSGCSVVSGSGQTASETRQVSGFTGIDLSGICEVIIEQGGTESPTIEADDNVLPVLTSEVDDPYLTTVSAATAATTPAAGSAADPGWRSTWVGRHRIGVFLLLAFALSWWAWPLALLNPESSAQVSFGPIIAALLVAAVAGGRGQAVRLLRAVVRWRVPWSRYVIAVAGPFLVTAVVAVLAGSFAVINPVPVSEAFGWFQEEPAPADLLAVVLSRATLAYRRRPRPSQAERDTLSSSTSAGAVSSG